MLAQFRKKKTKKRKKYNRIKKNKTREKNTRVLIALKTAGTKKRIFVAFFRSISLKKKIVLQCGLRLHCFQTTV